MINRVTFIEALNKCKNWNEPCSIKLIASHELKDILFPDYIDEYFCEPYTKTLKANDDLFIYYTREKDKFFVCEAIRIAKSCNKKFIIFENIS